MRRVSHLQTDRRERERASKAVRQTKLSGNTHVFTNKNEATSSFLPLYDNFPSLLGSTMVSHSSSCHDLFFVYLLILTVCLSNVSTGAAQMSCSNRGKSCSAILYHSDAVGLTQDRIAFFYSVDSSKVTPFPHGGNKQDFLITVPCSCEDSDGVISYLYDVVYTVQKNDTFDNVSTTVFSGQALKKGGEELNFTTGNTVTIHLTCGCLDKNPEAVIVTYTIQLGDVLSEIAHRLDSQIGDIEKLNNLQNPDSIYAGSVLYVPKGIGGKVPPSTGASNKLPLILGTLSALVAVAICILLYILIRGGRKKPKKHRLEGLRIAFDSFSAAKGFSMKSQFHHKGSTEYTSAFGSERPVIYSLDEIEEATNNFDESKKIGSGGYACVYHGILGAGLEVAIKKMRSNKSKEFFAELKVLCKIHHRNVVELLGYASGDDHFYLVYEYVQNGSLSDHLHNPLVKGHQPLSWTARVNIALDAAKGIEYIHDHTKARYVHRDIKTSNILLDGKLRAKVADFGLAKLVERGDEEFLATRLVGTPGYLPPESVKELQVTSKTDVFAFGVVLAELITGQHALIRHSKESNKMRSLISIFDAIFQDEDPESAMADVTDGNLRCYPMDEVYKMGELSQECLSEDPVNRPEMRAVVVRLSEIVMSSTEWEASLAGNSPVFSGLFNGR